jgi:hypothetical protein
MRVCALVMTMRAGKVVRAEAFSIVEDAVPAPALTRSDRESVLAELGRAADGGEG